MKLQLRNNLRVEEIDGEAIALDAAGAIVHRITGDSVETLRLISDGIDEADLPAHLAATVQPLVEAGVVASTGLSRRKLMLAAGVATAGITTFALATPAAATSGCPGAFVPSTLPYNITSTAAQNFNTRFGVTSVVGRGWGGGGSGGGHPTAGGPGGGGGAFEIQTITGLTGCTAFAITSIQLPTGGALVAANNDGNDGKDGKFTIVGKNFKAQMGKKGKKDGTTFGTGGAITVGGFAGGDGVVSKVSNVGGGGGGSGGSSSIGVTATSQTGGAGGSGTFAGAKGGNGGNAGAAGIAGAAPGAGGGGNGNGQNSGAGADGSMWIDNT